ncbi:annexin A6 [Podarcis muralis]
MSSRGKAGRYRGSVKDYPDFDANQDAEALYNAMKGFGSDKEAILELITSRSNKQRHEICQAYKALYGKVSLRRDCSVLQALRNQKENISLACILCCSSPSLQSSLVSQKLSDVSGDDSTSLETRFMTVLCTQSYPQLRRVFQEFVKMTNHDVAHAINKRMSGDVRDVFLAIVRSVKNKQAFFADKLYKSMKGAGTDDRTLIRIIVSRSEIDLLNIRREFWDIYDKSLYHMIEKDTSGDYCKALLAICGEEK